MDPPSTDVTFSQKMQILWQTNKPLVIAIITAIILIVIGIILLIVFLVIKPGSTQSAATTSSKSTSSTSIKAGVNTATHAVRLAYHHLRRST